MAFLAMILEDGNNVSVKGWGGDGLGCEKKETCSPPHTPNYICSSGHLTPDCKKSMIAYKEFQMLKRLPLMMLVVGASSAWGQQVISAHSGVIHLVEGQVTLDGKTVQPKFAEFPDVKNGQTLAAQDGRAEVLLTPGVILRIAENSSFKMISNSRSDTRLAIESGSAIVEVDELLPSNAITLLAGNTHIELLKKGLYRVDAEGDPGKLRVYDGEARVTAGEQTLVVRKGRQLLMGAVLEMGAFDIKDADAFMRWASRRSEYLAQANVSSARTASNLGYVGSGGSYGSLYGGNGMGYGSAYGSLGMWAYNAWYGMFTYMPYSGMGYSPFGYAYYSPGTVGYYQPTGGGSNGHSAFPIASSQTSPHYNSSTGSYNMNPRGSYSSASGNTGRGFSAASNSGGFSGSSSGGGGGMSGGGMSSGAASHGGGSSGGMGGSRGK